MENSQNFTCVELADQQLDEVVGGFTVGETLYLKSGRTRCTVCGLMTNCVGTHSGTEGARLACVTLPCGHETYIPERALRLEE